MKDNVVSRLVIRSLLHLVISIVLSLISLALLYSVASFLYYRIDRFAVIRGIGKFVLAEIPNGLGLWLLGFIFFIIYYIVLKWIHYSAFGKINDTVRRIADGQLEMNHQIVIRQKKTFGVLARNVNQLSERLHLALEEERRAEQSKNELITNVSHDLRTPLTSVVGYLGLIEQDRYRDEVELRQYVAIAYEKSQHLHELINDLFEYTRMRHDTSALKMESIDLVEMLGQLLVQYHMPLQEAGMDSGLYSKEKHIIVRADPGKLVRVFENLISNAMQYGKEGRRVDVRISILEGQVSVEVVNYGEPISPLDLPHIFDRFYRADKSRTRWTGGSGLGLAISKSIVEKHSGHIEVFSNSEETVFRVTLPIAWSVEQMTRV